MAPDTPAPRRMVGAPPSAAPPRLSMVGAPPTSKSAQKSSGRTPATPTRTSTPRTATKRGAAAVAATAATSTDEGDDEDEDPVDTEENAEDETNDEAEDVTAASSSKKKRKKRRKLLTDNSAKAKRRAERRAEKDRLRAEADDNDENEKEEPSPEKEPSEQPEQPPELQQQQKAPAVRDFSSFQLFLDHILRKLVEKDPDEFFCFPVTASQAPDYHNIIAEPMDFTTMRSKLESDAYPSLAEFRTDADLVVANALQYNAPHTVYNLAASRLKAVVNYYFSQAYLRYAFHTLPFGRSIALEKLGLEPVSAHAKAVKEPESKRAKQAIRAAFKDNATADEIAAGASAALRERLATRKPAKLVFVDNQDGSTVLSVLGSESTVESGHPKRHTIGQLVGPLEQGTPGLVQASSHRLCQQVPCSWLSYGAWCSFAPSLDTAWATLDPKHSALLLRTYGDMENATDAGRLRRFAQDLNDDRLVERIDDLLDTLTDGEHRRCVDVVENTEKEPIKDYVPEPEDWNALLEDVESLANLGIDMGWVAELRNRLNAPGKAPPTLERRLDSSGQLALDAVRLQRRRLTQIPPTTLTNAPKPGQLEVKAATQLVDQVQALLSGGRSSGKSKVAHLAALSTPEQLGAEPRPLRNAMAIEQDDDDDILAEFFA